MNMKNVKNVETLEACRYCFMCRHVCTSGLLTYSESDTPRGRALQIYNVHKGGAEFNPDMVDSIYNCFLCGCCFSWCEGKYNMSGLIKSIRKDIVDAGKVPEIAAKIRESILKYNNPYMENGIKKTKDSGGKKTSEVLYYMGAGVNFKQPEIADAVKKILDKIGIKYTILNDEPATGKILELLGFTSDARNKASELYEKIKKSGCKVLVTSDPLAYDAFKNDYPNWGMKFEPKIKIMHTSEYFLTLVKNRRLKIKKSKEKITLVDSEYLGRFNGIFDAPRDLIKLAAGDNFVEMRWNREKLLATGEAGFLFKGHIFDHGKVLGKRICEMALEAGAEKVVTLSPVAKNNLAMCKKIKVIDIVEFITEMMI